MVVGTRGETGSVCSAAAGELTLSTCTKPNSPSKTLKPPSREGKRSQSCLENNITGRKNSAWLAWDERDPQNRVPLDGQGLEMGLLGDSGWGSPASITHPGWDWPPAKPRSWGNGSLLGRRRLPYSFEYFP